jgi:hypothetical protein
MCFDIDNGDLYDGDLLAELKAGTTAISQYEFFVHSSRSHTPVKPRLRLVFILEEACSAAKYNAFARIVAEKLDDTMQTVDPVSFRLAQMMYFPSCSSDMEEHFEAFLNEGIAINVDETLEEWPSDWRDISMLPTCPGEDNLRATSEKAEDPRDKKGLIGAFCRAYDVYDVIEKFLSDIIVATDQDERFEYRDSEGVGGMVVYEDGLFIYSHHGTDPHSDLLLNAFDLLRLHKFDPDGKERNGEDAKTTTVTKLKSYKTMMDFIKDDENVRSQRVSERISPELLMGPIDDESPVIDTRDEAEVEVQNLLGALPDTAPSDPTEALLGRKIPVKDWMDDLELTDEGGFKATAYNAAVLLSNDPRMKGAFALNQLTEDVTLTRKLKPLMDHVPDMALIDRRDGDRIQDSHVEWVRTILSAPAHPQGMGYSLKLGKGDVGAAMHLSAMKHAFHPVRRYLKSLKWDGVKRMDTLFVDYLGAEDNLYHRETARLMLLGAVTRVFEPGHKFDTAVILEGKQGTRKSTLIRTLARGRWFTELDADLSNRQKTVEQMQGFWFVELPELSSFSKKDSNEIKQFISGTNDTVRMAYATHAAKFRRQCVFVGSTNDSQYLPDKTGNRRFWPVAVNVAVIDTEKLDREMDQIWAEVLHEYLAWRKELPKKTHEFLPLMLSDAADAIATKEQELRVRDGVEDLMAHDIMRSIDDAVPLGQIDPDQVMDDLDDTRKIVRNVYTTEEIWSDVLGRPKRELDSRNLFLLGKAMGAVPGWARLGRTSHKLLNGRPRVYARETVSCDGVLVGDFYTAVEDPEDFGLL